MPDEVITPEDDPAGVTSLVLLMAAAYLHLPWPEAQAVNPNWQNDDPSLGSPDAVVVIVDY